MCDRLCNNMSLVQHELLLKLSESSSLSRRLEYHRRRMGIGEEEGLGSGKSSITAEVQCFHLVHFHLIQVDDNILSQLALPMDSDTCAGGQCLPCGPTPPSPPKYFYIPSESPGKSRQRPLQTTTSAISSLQECSPLSQSQRNHGRLDLSMYFAPMDHASSVNMVSYSICIHLVSSFSLAQQHTSSAHDHTSPVFSLPFLNWKQKFPSPRVAHSGCTSHL